MGWLLIRLPAPVWGVWLTNDVPACRGLARGRGSKEARAPASSFWNQACPPRVPSRVQGQEVHPMAAVIIGIDPHKASHTAVVISAAEEPLGELRVRACAAQAEQLLAWAAAWPQRTWAVEERPLAWVTCWPQDCCQPGGGAGCAAEARCEGRLLAAGDTSKNDPDDARSVAVAALRSPGVRHVVPDDHAAVLKVWSKRYRDLGRSRTQVVCRLHAVLRAGPRRGRQGRSPAGRPPPSCWTRSRPPERWTRPAASSPPLSSRTCGALTRSCARPGRSPPPSCRHR